ncbi:phosphopantetheine-protein transferase [Stanieria cyanosphaera PCC 7437]|uniref:Phosphopantetheine-protein transferase n=1 Tax=Stanieria cyanosphaera (strain ATCC 29371 / PCC 7437) TaxID=111780 RepID=K9XNB4_STAC7|nr:4'-phosphopantetheinyl transferase superfamily protein [Stanieria cyanosphaera]AFZ34028.1 phosphopantetheine-protein transferase [Stanieria cyanosphaera PCC 7437]
MEKVVEIVAKIAGKSATQVLPETSLGSLGITSSIQILKIQSALERQYQQKLPFLGDSWTVERIAAQVGVASLPAKANGAIAQPNTAANFNGNTAQIQPVNLSNVSIGVDIEEINNLPDTSNYRTHEFYQTLFSSEEISYALLKNEPKLHLCGIFCAKEALKKAAPELINLRMEEIRVTHQQGRPLITTSDLTINSTFNFQVSISHASNYAVAMVLAIKLN